MTHSQTMQISGPTGNIMIKRTSEGIPEISAANDLDLAFGNGWIHAQDRLYFNRNKNWLKGIYTNLTEF